MGISNLATKYGFESISNFTKGRAGEKVNKIVIHHVAGTNFDSMPGIWNTRQASAHYGIGVNGAIRAYVDENNTAWHAGNWDDNVSSIGIEHTNSGGAPSWPIAQATIDASAKLCADIAKRHGLGQLVPMKNLFPHSHFSATSCPGVLLGKLQEIANKANAINNGTTPTTPTAGLYRVRKSWSDAKSQKGAFKNIDNAKKCADANKGCAVFDEKGNKVDLTTKPTTKSTDTLAREVIRGDWGNGANRKNRLEKAGYNYNAVQKRVNELL